MDEVTRILDSIQAGDGKASDELLPLVYEELRRLAAARMARETPDHTLQPTALVHEAYLRLVGDSQERSWDNRGHFFAAAAEAMRRILINHARDKERLKRGGDRQRVDLSTIGLGETAGVDDFVAFNDAVEQLERLEPQAAAIVKIRCFAGLSLEDAASALCLSRRKAEKYWAFARSWLYKELHPGHP